ncbi:MAG TPA: hypothetical protein VFU07_04305 [Candidatus Lumbricidophila sp.]|nr:hypothetical protein [Candidatus Lumbricidophila sp.]
MGDLVFVAVGWWLALIVLVIASAVLATLAFAVRHLRVLLWIDLVIVGMLAFWVSLPAQLNVPRLIVPFVLVLLVTAALGGGPLAVTAIQLSSDHLPHRIKRALFGRIDDDSPLGGGRVIGVLERVLCAGAIIVGYPEAIAAIIALKGIGRFSELDSAATRERFIIGSLASLGWAAVIGVVTRLVVATIAGAPSGA